MMQRLLAERLRILRARKGLTLTEASERIGITRHTLRSLELGGQDPHYPTLRKIAEGYGVPVEELLEEQVLAGRPEDGPSLEELHAAAGCKTDWLTKPEAEWQASWPRRSLSPQDAMQIVQEVAEEFSALKPLIAAQEDGLPIYKSAISGRYRQAWLRFFEGVRAAKRCGVANGLITEEETLNDLEERLLEKGLLGETPGVRYEGMLVAS